VRLLGFGRAFHRLNKIAAYGLGQGFSRPTAASPSGVKPASRSDAARRADALDSLGERPRCIRRSLVGLSQSTAQRGSDDDPNCVLCDGRVDLGPLRLPKPIRSLRSQLAGSTAARGGSDLPLPKPSKGATLCPQLPGIWGTSVEIHRCQDSLMRHQRDRGYPNERDFLHVQNSAQQLSRRA
jgi:hypothetical protein